MLHVAKSLQAPVASSLVRDLLAMSRPPQATRKLSEGGQQASETSGGVLEATDALHLLGSLLVRAARLLPAPFVSPQPQAKLTTWFWQKCSFHSLHELEGLIGLGAYLMLKGLLGWVRT
jgi:hypothetical protein